VREEEEEEEEEILEEEVRLMLGMCPVSCHCVTCNPGLKE
jgi:hypothetical protein